MPGRLVVLLLLGGHACLPTKWQCRSDGDCVDGRVCAVDRCVDFPRVGRRLAYDGGALYVADPSRVVRFDLDGGASELVLGGPNAQSLAAGFSRQRTPGETAIVGDSGTPVEAVGGVVFVASEIEGATEGGAIIRFSNTLGVTALLAPAGWPTPNDCVRDPRFEGIVTDFAVLERHLAYIDRKRTSGAGSLKLVELSGPATDVAVTGQPRVVVTQGALRAQLALTEDVPLWAVTFDPRAGSPRLIFVCGSAICAWEREVITLIAGDPSRKGAGIDGPARAARFDAPSDLVVADDGTIFVLDRGNMVLRRVSTEGNVTTLAGTTAQLGTTDGDGPQARFLEVFGLALGGDGDLYMVDGHRLRRISASGRVTTVHP